MLEKDTILKVRNRDNGGVGYTIPDLGNLHRTFQAGEEKEISMEELRKLSYLPGGKAILKNYLVIEDNPEAVEELLSTVEPEYYYTDEDIKKLLTEGTLDQFQDCLDFAPEGTVNLLKKYAVELELNDVAKRKALLEATGFNVTTAIEANRKDDLDEEEAPVKTRRTAAINSSTQGRRTNGMTLSESKYKVVNR